MTTRNWIQFQELAWKQILPQNWQLTLADYLDLSLTIVRVENSALLCQTSNQQSYEQINKCCFKLKNKNTGDCSILQDTVFIIKSDSRKCRHLLNAKTFPNEDGNAMIYAITKWNQSYHVTYCSTWDTFDSKNGVGALQADLVISCFILLHFADFVLLTNWRLEVALHRTSLSVPFLQQHVFTLCFPVTFW